MRILFHHPLPLDPNAKSASGIRPLRILQAFKELGYQVDLVTGYAKERKAAIMQVKENIKNGINYDFMYAESSTMPTILTEKHHLPTHPFMDWFFFRFCKKNNIPIGLFYRDIYWLFDEYGKGLNPIKSSMAKLAYRFDLWVYQKTLKNLYLPSYEMGEYVPYVQPEKFAALPPGHVSPKSTVKSLASPIKLFYVGGLSNHYQMHTLFSVLADFPDIQFTLCTRETEWQAMKDEYPQPSKNIRIIHETGATMEAELLAADIAMLYVKPQEYREFAAPVKLFEYIGFRKPILASSETLAGRFVAANNVGWTIEYEQCALKKFLTELQSHPEMLLDKNESLEKVALLHSWKARAKQVAEDLTQ